MPVSSNPYDRLDRRLALTKQIEELAGEYWAKYQPLRDSLSAVLLSINDNGEWRDVFFNAGAAIRAAGLSDVPAVIRDSQRWNIAREEEGRPGWGVSELLDAAAKEDRARFDILVARVFQDTEGLSRFPKVLKDVAEHLCSHLYRRLAPDFLNRAETLCKAIGDPFTVLLNESVWATMNDRTRSAIRQWNSWQENGDAFIPDWCCGLPTYLISIPVNKTDPTKQEKAVSIGSTRNPLHVIIDLLILHERTLIGVHQASTNEKRQQALEEWYRCHSAVWGSSSSRNDTIRTLADPAKAWLARANSRYVEAHDFNLVEECVYALSSFAISPSPMAMPDVYSKRYNTEEELWQKWTDQGERLVAMDSLIARLKELGARAGEVWTAEPPLQQGGISWTEGHSTVSITGNPAGRATEMIKVLLLSANPLDAPLSIEQEFRAIDAKIRGSDHRDHVQLILHGAVRLEDIPNLLMRHKPHVVHFSGHGNTGAIELTRADGSSHSVEPETLAEIFRVLKDNVRVVLLNACDSAPQAKAIVGVIDCAVGMSDEIVDDTAIAFAAAFYEALGYGRSVQDAFDLALVQLTATGADRSLAKLHKKRGVKPSEIILVNPPRPR